MDNGDDDTEEGDEREEVGEKDEVGVEAMDRGDGAGRCCFMERDEDICSAEKWFFCVVFIFLRGCCCCRE